MSKLSEILEYNKKFVEEKEFENYITSKVPEKKMVILSCMDTRLTELLPKAMNIKNGDVKLIKNAGGTVMHPFGGIMRSILVGIYEFEADEVLIIGHTGCGMSNLNVDSTYKKLVYRGVSTEVISTLENAGINIKKWLHGFDSVRESVVESVGIVKSHPLLPKDVYVHGLIIDSATGELEVVVNGYENEKA